MSLESLNSAVASSGGSWLKLRSTTDPPISGEIVDFEEREKSWEGQPVLSRTTGKPRIEWVLTLKCDPDPTVADDDGLRKIACNESMRFAITDAIKASPNKRADLGGRLQIAVTADAPDTYSQASYVARYTPPAVLQAPPDAPDPFAAL